MPALVFEELPTNQVSAEPDAEASQELASCAAAEPDVKQPEGATPKASRNLRVSDLGTEHLKEELQRRTVSAKSTRGSVGVFVREADYEAILRNVGRKEKEAGQMKKVVLLLLGVLLLLAAVTLCTSMAAVELSKESHVQGGALVDTNGGAVATRSADLNVCGDGSLARAGQCAVDSAGRRLQDGSPDGTLKTMPTKESRVLASSLSDEFFMALDEVVVYSDKGHTLRLSIHGFSRIPVLNARCGNIVHLYTAWNGRLTLDSTDLSFDAETESAFANAGFSLAVGGVSGRRLAIDHTVEGFFTAVQGVEAQGWTCQDVPLPTLPETYHQQITVYKPCAVAGVTGTELDPCDSIYGGVVPGTGPLSRANQLATMTKTARIRASLSVDVPIESTLFLGFDVEVMKSTSYELQITSMQNHPGQLKVNVFDRRSSEDAYFQILSAFPSDGRFFCNTSGTEATPQKTALQGEKEGVNRKMHFELMDMVEEDGRILRHFRMMPAESFLEWMGAKPASERPTEAYYEYWDVAEDMTPHRLVNPDGTVVVFRSSTGGTTDTDVEAKLKTLGSEQWASLTACSDAEKEVADVLSPTLGMAVPIINSPMSDLNRENLAFYAKLSLDTKVEAETGNGWETLQKAAAGGHALSGFAEYALRSHDPTGMPDLCRDVCATSLAAVRDQLKADPTLEFCDAPGLNALTTCMTDVAGLKNALCAKSNFIKNLHGDCFGADEAEDDAAGGRRLSEDGDDYEADASLEGSEAHLHRLAHAAAKRGAVARKSGPTRESSMTRLADGSHAIDLSTLDAEQRAQLAEAIGVASLTSGRVLFNASDSEPSQKVPATLEASDAPGSALSRRLMLDMNCKAPNIGWGCIFSIGYPWGCDAGDNDPPCRFGIAVKVQVGGPFNGALSVSGAGCIEEWAFGVPKPFSGSVCIDGGISVSFSSWCGFPFSLSGWLGLTAQVGLDLVIFSFSFASIRIEAGAGMVHYKYNCDDRRRRRRGWGGRRRGADQTCATRCDIKVYAKATFQVLIGRVWGLVQYYVSNRDFDFIVGADIYIWLIFTSWWETVAQVQIV